MPMFHQLEGLAIDEDITLADLQGVLLAFARQMFGEHTEVRLRPGYFPFTEPSVEVDVSCFRCGGTGYEGSQRCFTCKGEGWIEILGSGMVDPNVLDYVAGSGYDKERVQGFAFGMGIERIASVVHEVPDLRMLYENDAPPPGAVRRMRVPLGWLREYCDPGTAGRGDRGHADDGRGQAGAAAPGRRGGPRRVRRRARCSRPSRIRRRPADGLHRRHRRRRAEHDRLRRAERGRRPDRGGGAARRDHARRHAARRGEAARGQVERDDPGRGRGGHRRGPPGTMVLDESLPVGAPLAEHLPIADEVLELEITPNRPGLHGASTASRATCTRSPRRRWPRTRQRATPSRRATTAPRTTRRSRSDPEICLRFTARVFEDVKIGPSPLWLKQRLTAAGQRPISNVVDITNYVMLLTRPAAARVRPRRGARRADRRAPRGGGRDDDARSTAWSGRSTREMALVCDAEGPSGIAGVMGGEISEVSDDTTRVLMEAATWVGPNIMRTSKALGLRTEASAPLREAAASRAGNGGAAAGGAADGGALRRAAGARDDRRVSAPGRAAQGAAARRAMEKLLGERGARGRPRAAILERLGFQASATAPTASGRGGAALARQSTSSARPT